MCDADLSMPIEELSKFIPANNEQIDIAIASREAAGAVRYNEPEYRHLGGRLVNFAIRLFILPGFQDTQCGFKCFRRTVTEEIFPYQTIPGWSFDIEILYIALKRGYLVTEVPIHWYFDPETKLRAVNDALLMLRDIFLIRWNNLRGLYDPQN
jgi:dolichyl-phosphate beta-glucosyltransferase